MMSMHSLDFEPTLFEPDLNFCVCGCEAELAHERNPQSQHGKKRYVVRCLDDGCGNIGRYASYPWQAILDWNKSPLSDFPEFPEIPFMSLTGMTYDDLQQKLRDVRADLEQSVKTLKDAGKTMQQDALREAKAKLMWVIYAQSWTKVSARSAPPSGSLAQTA